MKKYEKVFLVMNEQHSLLDDQVRVLEEKFKEADIEKVLAPAKGWTLEEMDAIIRKMYLELVLQATPKFPHLDSPIANQYYYFTTGKKPTAVAFLSPIPYMVKELSQLAMKADIDVGCTYSEYDVFVFHNDHRAKKELDNGKVIYTVAKEGWELV